MAAYGIALPEERAGLVTAPSLPATDYDLEPEHTMDYQTEETEEDPDIQVVGSEKTDNVNCIPLLGSVNSCIKLPIYVFAINNVVTVPILCSYFKQNKIV